MTTYYETFSATTASAEQELESPFIETATWTTSTALPAQRQAWHQSESPFVNEFVVGDQTIRPETAALAQLYDQLYDNEFDAALTELASEAETYVDELGMNQPEADEARAEQMLETWLEPLRRQTHAMLAELSETFETESPLAMSEERLSAIFDSSAATHYEQGPAFEGFLNALKKKLKTVAAGAVKAAASGLAKIVPISAIFRQIAVLAQPLLTRVLKFALDKLPVAYREPAKQLASKLLGTQPSEPAQESSENDFEETESIDDERGIDEQPAGADIRELQESFDAGVAELVFASSESSQDLYLAEVAASNSVPTPSPLPALDAARRRFIDGIGRLEAGADPTPLVQNFIPAVLPALRFGVKLARPRIVNFLAGYVGRLIAPYVEPTVKDGMSRAIVDAGLAALSLETETEADTPSPSIAAEAFASLVEDTVARVAQLDDTELADHALLEEATYTAFHEAAAANFPAAVLSPENEFAESGRARGTWVTMPRGGPPRYRKYSDVFNVVVYPAAARTITTFGGTPLSAFLRDRLGRSGPVRARIHLYQAVPGSSLARIARMERGVAGLGSSDVRARSRLHPLTPMAAAALIGEPGLGRRLGEVPQDGTGPLAIGQRLYYLEAPNTPSEPTAGGPGLAAAVAAQGAGVDGAVPTTPVSATTTTPPRSSNAQVQLHPDRGAVTVTIYISESDAQSIAARLRRREPLGASLTILRRIYAPAINRVHTTGRHQQVRISSEQSYGPQSEDLVRQALRTGRGSGARAHLNRLPPRHPGRRQRRRHAHRRPLIFWTGQSLAAELDRHRDAFLHAVDEPADGVTIVLNMRPPALGSLLQPGGAQAAIAAGAGPVDIAINPGHPRA